MKLFLAVIAVSILLAFWVVPIPSSPYLPSSRIPANSYPSSMGSQGGFQGYGSIVWSK